MKQGCILAPVHFSIFFTCVLSHAVTDTNDGMYLKYRTDGSLFDLHHLSAKTKIVKKIILEALFADNCTLMAPQGVRPPTDRQHYSLLRPSSLASTSI